MQIAGPGPEPTPSTTLPTSTPTVQVTDPGVVGAPVAIDRVVNDMVAVSASVTPATVADGQLVYARIETAEAGATRLNERWLDPNGMQPVAIIIDGQVQPPPSFPDQLSPGSVIRPTPQWLAGLTTDPTELYRMFFSAMPSGPGGGSGKLPQVDYVFGSIVEFLFICEPILPAAQRAAVFRVLGQIAGIKANELNVAGRHLYLVQDPVFSDGLLLDPATGHAVGERWGDVNSPADDLWYYAIVDHVGQRG
jgi:hypothetical protein